MYQKGDRLEILPPETAGSTPEAAARVSQACVSQARPPAAVLPGAALPPGKKAALVTEADAKRLVKTGGKIRLPRGTIVTPAAKDVFYEAHCRIEWED
jgi:hypothetical protein